MARRDLLFRSGIITFFVTVPLAGATTTVGQLTAAIAQRERELSRTNQMLDELSRRDPLTNLVNRRELFGLLEEPLEAKDHVAVVMHAACGREGIRRQEKRRKPVRRLA